MQEKILKKKRKYIDALAFKISSMLYRHTKLSCKPSLEKVEKELAVFVKAAKLNHKKSDILELYNRHIKSEFKEIVFRKDFKDHIVSQ